jgi:hypothetical protein
LHGKPALELDYQELLSSASYYVAATHFSLHLISPALEKATNRLIEVGFRGRHGHAVILAAILI